MNTATDTIHMPRKQPKEDGFVSDILRHWPIVVFFAGMFITWGVFSNRIQNTEQQIAVMKAEQAKTSGSVSDVRESLAKIETSLEFIKERLK